MKATANIIKRELFEFEIEDKSDVTAVQKSLTEILNSRIPTLIDEICSKYSNDKIIELDKVEIDLEEIELENIEEQISGKFSKEFEKIIIDKIKAIPDNEEIKISRIDGSNLEIISQFLLTGRLPWWAVNTEELNIDDIFIEILRTEPDKLINTIISSRKKKNVISRLEKQFHQNTISEFYDYLKKTIHDDSQVQLDDIDAILEIIKTNLPHAFNLSEIKILLALYILSNPAVSQSNFYNDIIRILADYYYISEEQFFTVILSSVIAKHTAIFRTPTYIKVISEILLLSTEEKVQNELVLAIRENKKGEINISEIFNTYRKQKARQESEIADEKKSVLEKASAEENAELKRSQLKKMRAEKLKVKKESKVKDFPTENDTTEMEKIILSGKPEEKLKTGPYEINEESREVEEVIDSDAIEDFNIAEREKGRALTEELGLEENEEVVIPDLKLTEDLGELADGEIYIDNAGLVIIAPFFPRLFEILNITAEGEIGSEFLKEKAVHILQYLVNGKSNNPEYLLQLNKLLCGMNIDDIISREYRLSDFEKTECENLLRSIIKNWNSLKNTSIESFRNSFLARKGVLKYSENGWTLNVERKSYDILLNTLPWSISIIKLKWMNKPIYVEW